MSVGKRIYTKRNMPDPAVVEGFKSIPASNTADCMNRDCAMNPRIHLVSSPSAQMMCGPALEARNFQSFRHPAADTSMYLTVLDRDGRLLPEVREILDVAADFGLVVGTGNLSTEEGMALARETGKRGITLVLTHADNPADRYTIAQQREAVKLGAMVEHAYNTSFNHRVPFEEVVRQIKEVGCENVLLPTNFGQARSPYPDEGIEMYQEKLIKAGFTETELRQMFIENPSRLFG